MSGQCTFCHKEVGESPLNISHLADGTHQWKEDDSGGFLFVDSEVTRKLPHVCSVCGKVFDVGSNVIQHGTINTHDWAGDGAYWAGGGAYDEITEEKTHVHQTLDADLFVAAIAVKMVSDGKSSMLVDSKNAVEEMCTPFLIALGETTTMDIYEDTFGIGKIQMIKRVRDLMVRLEDKKERTFEDNIRQHFSL